METRQIQTRLVGKEELFRILAIGEALKLPVLFIGEPGVAKTQGLIDYAASMYKLDAEVIRAKCFLLELDEGSQTSEVKGRVNMKKYLEDKQFDLDTPITAAEFIMINEVDKGSSGIRNTLLSVMRERALFLGHEVRKCNWKVFSASCNSIPGDESGNPFWDRFIIKYGVERLKKEMVPAIWDRSKTALEVNIPNDHQRRD
jgi:MoxR-like ATPase